MPRLEPDLPARSAHFRGALELARAGVFGFLVSYSDLRRARRRITRLRRENPRLLFAADAERGLGQVLRGATWGPCAAGLGASGDPALTHRLARTAGSEARLAGVDLLLAPVADLHETPRSQVMSARCFGDDPARVGRHAAAFIRGVHEGGALCCVKHFPGHGSVSGDTHASAVLDHADAPELQARYTPFNAALRARCAAVMVAHLVVKGLDAREPASLSRAVVHGVLREQLGFRGVVITDGLEMRAVRDEKNPARPPAKAVRAGCDLLLLPPDPWRVMDGLAALIDEDPEFRAAVDRARVRLSRLASRAGRGRGLGASSRPRLTPLNAKRTDALYAPTYVEAAGRIAASSGNDADKHAHGGIRADVRGESHGGATAFQRPGQNFRVVLLGDAWIDPANARDILGRGPLCARTVFWPVARARRAREAARRLFRGGGNRVALIATERAELPEASRRDMARLLAEFPGTTLALAGSPALTAGLPETARLVCGFSGDAWWRPSFLRAVAGLGTCRGRFPFRWSSLPGGGLKTWQTDRLLGN